MNGYTKRQCDNCQTWYQADNRNLQRGWGLCCSKSCAAAKREKSKPGYNATRVMSNNARRGFWNEGNDTPIVLGCGGSQREIDRGDRLTMQLEDDGSWDTHQAFVGRCEWCECLVCRCDD